MTSAEQYASENGVSTHDMELLVSVIKIAQDPGYVLIGPTERVWRRHENRRGQIESVPLFEDGAVHQLIAQGLFRIGCSVHVGYRQHEGDARVVLATRAAGELAHRWRSYKRSSRAT